MQTFYLRDQLNEQRALGQKHLVVYLLRQNYRKHKCFVYLEGKANLV